VLEEENWKAFRAARTDTCQSPSEVVQTWRQNKDSPIMF
jgi:hypothetical protein